MLLATDPGVVGLLAAVVAAAGSAAGYLLRGGLRDTTADRIFKEIDTLRAYYERKWREAEAEIERDRLWKSAARAVLAKYANGDPEAKALLGGMKMLEDEKPNLADGGA